MKKYTAPKFEILEIELEDVLVMSNKGDYKDDQGKPEWHSADIAVDDSDFSND